MDINTTHKKSPHMKTRLVFAAIALLVLALGFNALLSTSSLEKLYVESLISSYKVIGQDLQRKIEKSLRFGKKIDNFLGIEAMLETTLAFMKTEGDPVHTQSDGLPDKYVAVTATNSVLRYSTAPVLVGTPLPDSAVYDYGLRKDRPLSDIKTSHFTKYKSKYIVTLPLRDREGDWQGTLVMAFDERQVKALLANALQYILQIGMMILVSGIVFLIVLLGIVLPKETREAAPDKNIFPKTRITIVLFVIIALCQIVFSTLNTNSFKQYYIQITKDKSIMLNALMQKDIEYLLEKGIHMDRLFKMEVMMGEILTAMPEMDAITLFNANDEAMYLATPSGNFNFTERGKLPESERLRGIDLLRRIPRDVAEYNTHLDLLKQGSREGYIITTISQGKIRAKLRETMLDSATVLIISILFFVEILILIFQFFEKQVARTQHIQKKISAAAIRPAAFLFLFGIDVSISFLPLHMEKIFEPIFGLSMDVMMGLPISVEMFFVGITLFIAGIWLDRRGWHEPFIVGLFFSGIGVLYSWLSPDSLHFIISRAVVGIGYGLALMAAQGFVIAFADERRSATGLAQLFAGVYAGSICGGAAGAMLAERIGYNPVFFIGAVIIFLVIIYAVFFMRDAMIHPNNMRTQKTAASTSKTPMRQWLKFLFNRNVISLTIFSSLPMALALVGYINYFSPIYLNRIGESQSNIGRIYMIYGVCMIYLAPLISSFVDTSRNKKHYIVISGFLCGVAFILFNFFDGLLVAALAVLFLGLASSFGFAASNAFALGLKVTRELGSGKAIGIFASATRLGQVMGPVLFGWLALTVGIKTGITYLGMFYLLITLVFIFSVKNETETTAKIHTT